MVFQCFFLFFIHTPYIKIFLIVNRFFGIVYFYFYTHRNAIIFNFHCFIVVFYLHCTGSATIAITRCSEKNY